MDLLKKILTPLALSAAILMSCNNGVQNQEHPKLKSEISTSTLGTYQRPGGLSKRNNYSISKNLAKEGTTLDQGSPYFTVNPTYTENENSFSDKPGFYNINSPSSPLYEFTNTDLINFKINLLNDNGKLVPRGLNLETLSILGDIFVIPNVSDQIFRLYQDSTTGQFVQDTTFTLKNDELFGITGVLFNNLDGNFYISQIPLYDRSADDPNSFVEVRQKRIARLSLSDIVNGIINPTFFPIPDRKSNDPSFGMPNSLSSLPSTNQKYAGDFFQFGDILKITENSSGEIYIADSLDRRIYSFDSSNGAVKIFKDLDRPITSIAIDSADNLIVVKGILLDSNGNVAFPSELTKISPNGDETDLCLLNNSFNFTSEATFEQNVPIEGVNYFFPEQDFSSLSVSETDTSLNVYYAGYLDGIIQEIIIPKPY